MMHHGVSSDGLSRAILLVEPLSVVQNDKFHLGQELISVRHTGLVFVWVGDARVDLEEEFNPVVMSVEVVALNFSVLASSRSLHNIVDRDTLDDLG